MVILDNETIVSKFNFHFILQTPENMY